MTSRFFYLRIQDNDFRYATTGVLRKDVKEGRSVHDDSFRLQTWSARRDFVRITSVPLNINGVWTLRNLPAGEEHLHLMRTFRLWSVRHRVRQVSVLIESDINLENAIESVSSGYDTRSNMTAFVQLAIYCERSYIQIIRNSHATHK